MRPERDAVSQARNSRADSEQVEDLSTFRPSQIHERPYAIRAFSILRHKTGQVSCFTHALEIRDGRLVLHVGDVAGVDVGCGWVLAAVESGRVLLSVDAWTEYEAVG